MQFCEYRTHADGPLTSIEVIKGAVIVSMTYDRLGDYTRLHSHPFGHWMTCKKGSAIIMLDGVEKTVRAGDRYFVEANKQHGVMSMEAGTVLECEHLNDDITPDGTDGIPLEWLSRLTNKGNHARL